MYPMNDAQIEWYITDKVQRAYQERKPVMGASDDDYGGHGAAMIAAKVAVLQDILDSAEALGQTYLPTGVVRLILEAKADG